AAGGGPRPTEGPALRARERAGALAAAAVIAAAALHDRTALALPLLVLAGAAAAAWARAAGWRQRASALVPRLPLGALLRATGWEIAYRWQLRRELATRLLPGLAPPTHADLGATWNQIDAWLAGADLARQAPRTPEGLRPNDLAYLLWRGSPL